MTGSKQQEHCGHECVCGQLCATRARQEGKPCEPGYLHWSGCNYDTRQQHSAGDGDAVINPTESDSRGYRCLHCEVRNDVRFCHYHGTNVISLPEHDAAIKAEAQREEREKTIAVLKWLYGTAECVPLKEDSREYDKGFHQAMSFVRGWIKQKCESLRRGEP